MTALRTSLSAPAEHARCYRDAVLARMVRRLAAGTPDWLQAEFGDAPAALDPEAELAAIESAAAADGVNLPLARIDRLDAMLVCAVGLIEDDIRFGAVFAKHQEPLAARRPCVGLISWLLSDPLDASARHELVPPGRVALDGGDLRERAQALVNRGLFTIDNIADPRSEWVPRIPPALWDLVRHGVIVPASLPPSLVYDGPEQFPELSDVIVTGELADAVKRLPELMSSPSITAIVLRGMDGSGRDTVLGATGRSLGRGRLIHDGTVGDAGWLLLPALAELGDAAPVARLRPGPGDTVHLPALPGLRRPLGIALGRSGGLSGPPTERAIGFSLTPCTGPQRRTLWARSVAVAPEDLDVIVESFLLTPGNIHRAADLASAAAAAAGREQIVPGDVRTATGALRRQSLETLATRLEPLHFVTAPVMGPAAAEELTTLLARCRQRERLSATDGSLPAGTNRGVRALFTGPSGTGKTLTARYLGALLNLDVYRVDLAAVVNKYIGETERNLDQVLARAEELDVLLLLDEGDSLMSRRTEVSNANDRYANLETNFLLQRLETFDGIVVVTTNADSRIDPAFLRRIDVTVDFVPPDADQRWLLWQAHLPDDHETEPSLLAEIARRCALTGGQIRNAALHARLRGLERDGVVDGVDVLAAVQREYRRSGASFPLAGRVATSAWAGHDVGPGG